jgi:hypothetical protein
VAPNANHDLPRAKAKVAEIGGLIKTNSQWHPTHWVSDAPARTPFFCNAANDAKTKQRQNINTLI